MTADLALPSRLATDADGVSAGRRRGAEEMAFWLCRRPLAAAGVADGLVARLIPLPVLARWCPGGVALKIGQDMRDIAGEGIGFKEGQTDLAHGDLDTGVRVERA